jgi:lipopolysaccharide/colanic/teichoic acid biosynthesis glycosyltransferase
MRYINERSLWMDLKIIFKTVSLIFSHEGAR